MNKILGLRLRRFVPVGLIALAAAVLLAPTPASATPYVVTLVQQGSNVVATGSGEFDLSGLTFVGIDPGSFGPMMTPGTGQISIGPYVNIDRTTDIYTGYSGPATFGSGVGGVATTGAGDTVGLTEGTEGGELLQWLFVPTGYTSGTALSDSATWDNSSFAYLGARPGTYVWTWGTAADQSFTLIIGSGVSVPEPAEFGMFGFGVLLIGGFVGLRRRAA